MRRRRYSCNNSRKYKQTLPHSIDASDRLPSRLNTLAPEARATTLPSGQHLQSEALGQTTCLHLVDFEVVSMVASNDGRQNVYEAAARALVCMWPCCPLFRSALADVDSLERLSCAAGQPRRAKVDETRIFCLVEEQRRTIRTIFLTTTITLPPSCRADSSAAPATPSRLSLAHPPTRRS